jgi:hypothetical protein
MAEDDTPPEEKPRYLLPDGCKDLIDALHLQHESEPESTPDDTPSATPQSPPEPLPATVSIPDPVLLRDLATALHLKSYAVIQALMHESVFATPQTEIDFQIASALCSRLGVVAHKVI